MARNQTLTQLLTDLRHEARRSSNTAHNNQIRDADVHLLRRIQDWLWDDYAWPHLRVKRDIALQAGQRYYDTPEDLAIDRINYIEIKDGQTWRRLEVGIGARELNIFDSDTDERSWPVARWQISEDNLEAIEQIEVWPIPDSNGDDETLDGYMRVVGIRNLQPFVDGNDRCDLDGRLIVLYAAAEILASLGAKDATLKLSQAKKLDAKLRGGMMPSRAFRMFGVGQPEERKILRGPPTVYYRTDD